MQVKENKQEMLEESIQSMQNMLDALKDMLNGMSEEKACKVHNVNKLTLRYYVFNKGLGYQGYEPKDFDEKLLYLRSPEERLFADLVHPSEGNKVPFDIAETIPMVLPLLSQEEQDIIHMYYWEGLTLEEIGKKYNFTREYIRQKKNVIFRKLRTPSCLIILKLGKSYIDKLDELREKQIQYDRQQELTKLEEEINAINVDIDTNKIKELRDRLDTILCNTNNMYLLDDYEFKVHTRTYNLLKEKGYNYLDDLNNLDIIAFMKSTKNCGLTTVMDIINLSLELGFNLQGVDTFMTRYKSKLKQEDISRYEELKKNLEER